MTIVSIILLILTLGIFHYKASLKITPLDPALLQTKFAALTKESKGDQELTLGKDPRFASRPSKEPLRQTCDHRDPPKGYKT